MRLYPDHRFAWSTTMSARTRNFLSFVGRTIADFGESLAAARAMNDLCNTPDSTFRARAAALRAMMTRQ